MNLKMIDLFAGIGAFRLAFESFGVESNLSNSKLYCIAGNSIPVHLATKVAKAALDALKTK